MVLPSRSDLHQSQSTWTPMGRLRGA